MCDIRDFHSSFFRIAITEMSEVNEETSDLRCGKLVGKSIDAFTMKLIECFGISMYICIHKHTLDLFYLIHDFDRKKVHLFLRNFTIDVALRFKLYDRNN